MNLFNYFFHRWGEDEKMTCLVKGSSKGYNVTYKCSGHCDVVQIPNVPKGWKQSFSVHEGDYYYFSAQANSPESKIDLRIYQNGKLFKKISKFGNYPMVSSSGLIH